MRITRWKIFTDHLNCSDFKKRRISLRICVEPILVLVDKVRMCSAGLKMLVEGSDAGLEISAALRTVGEEAHCDTKVGPDVVPAEFR